MIEEITNNENIVVDIEKLKQEIRKDLEKELLSNPQVYKKLQKARMLLSKEILKKTGVNKFTGFDYFQLQDFLPELNIICYEVGICDVINIYEDKKIAIITIVDVDNPIHPVTFTLPLVSAEISKQQIQNVGGTTTYYRRYLYATAFNIVENDVVDDAKTSEELAKGDKKTKTKATKNVAKNNANRDELLKNLNKNIAPEKIMKWLQQNNYQTLNDVKTEVLEKLWMNYVENMKKTSN